MELVSGVMVTSFGPEDFDTLGQECLPMDRDFNVRVAIVCACEWLQEFRCKECILPYNLVLDVSRGKLREVFLQF